MSTEFNSTIRAISLGFGNLFKDIQVIRYDEGGEATRFLVPIQYANKEKYLSRLQGDPNLDRNVQVTLPAMSFEMTGLSYDQSRKQNTNIKNFYTSGTSLKSQYNPVPYDFDFQLYIYTRIEEDGVQIIERILPFFTPDYTIKVNLVPTLGVIKEIPILLTGTNYETGYEGDYKSDTRTIIWTLNFTVKGYMYIAPADASVIRQATTNIISSISQNDIVAFNMAQPGLGNYKIGEMVYQGYSLGTATATGKVVDWNNGILYVTNLQGNISLSQALIGAESHTDYHISAYNVAGTVPGEYVKIDIIPNPLTANANSFYTYTTAIQEGNGAPVVI